MLAIPHCFDNFNYWNPHLSLSLLPNLLLSFPYSISSTLFPLLIYLHLIYTSLLSTFLPCCPFYYSPDSLILTPVSSPPESSIFSPYSISSHLISSLLISPFLQLLDRTGFTPSRSIFESNAGTHVTQCSSAQSA